MQKTAGQVTVRGNEAGFNAPPDPRDSFEFKDGLFRSTRPFTNVACVVVALAGGEAQQYPVPILGGEPVSLQFETSLQAAEAAAFIRDATATLQRSADARHAQMICSDATAKLIDKQKNSDALARAKGGLQAADAADKSIADDLTRLKEQVALAPEGPKIVVAIEQNLKAMRGFNQKLGDHIKKLEDVVRRENDPTVGARQVQIESTVEKIKILLGGGNVEEAINAYDLLITLEPDNPDAKAQRDKLIAEWKPKSAEHAKARDYLLKTWPAIATIPDYVESLPRIGAAVDECIKNGDRFTMRKLLTVFTGSIVKLKELTDLLDQNSEPTANSSRVPTRSAKRWPPSKPASASSWRGSRVLSTEC